VLDSTFSICDKKIFLFILMGIDENQKGIPLTFLLFSVPVGNQKTCTGDNIEIIAKLLDSATLEHVTTRHSRFMLQ